MKKIILGLLCIFYADLALAQKAFQGYQDYSEKGFSEYQSRQYRHGAGPALSLKKLENTMSWIGRRLHTLSIETLVADMRKEGVTSRLFNPVFSAEGAFVYEADFRGHVSAEDLKAHWSNGRNTGAQVLPFKISINPINQAVKIDVPLFALREMRRRNEEADKDSYASSNFFRAVDQIDILSFRYDNGISNGNLRLLEVAVFDLNFKIDLKKFKKPEQHVTMKFGGELGFGRYQYQDNSGNEVILNIVTNTHIGRLSKDTGSLPAFFIRGRAGFEYQNSWNKVHLKVGLNCAGGFTRGRSADPAQFQIERLKYIDQVAQYEANLETYNQSLISWSQQKLEWVANSDVDPRISDADYIKMSGVAPPPNKPREVIDPGEYEHEVVRRAHFVVQPNIEIKGRVSKLRATQPTFVGAEISGNIPLKDRLQGNQLGTVDLSRHYNDLMKIKFFVNF